MDYSKYPDNWIDEIRPNALRKANYRCTRCKVPQRAKGYREQSGIFVQCDEFMLKWAKENNLKIITIHLQVAHTCHNPKCENELHHKAMCPRCHLLHDKSYHKAIRISNCIKKEPGPFTPMRKRKGVNYPQGPHTKRV